MEPITVTIGGEAIALPPIMNFATLERAWPSILALSDATDPVASVSAAAALVAAALTASRPELDVAEIKRRLRINGRDGTDERGGLSQAASQLLVASGLVPVGEAKPPEPPAAVAPAT